MTDHSLPMTEGRSIAWHQTRRHRIAASLVLGLITGAAIGTAHSSEASAATYQVRACQAASEYGYANRSWVASNSAPTFFETSTSCPTTGGQVGGIHVGERLAVVGFTPLGSGAGFRFTAPAGTTISALSYSRFAGQWSDNSKVPALLDDEGQVIAGETCIFDAWASECSFGSSSPTIANRTINGLDTQTLDAAITCRPAAPATSCTGSSRYGMNAWFSVFASTVTITQSTAPSVTASPLSGGWTRSLPVPRISSTDPSGAQRARVYVDGTRVVDEALACDYTRPAPCDNLTARSVAVSDISDGTHSIIAAATNAAGMEGRSSPQTVRIDRTPPPPPADVGSDAGTSWQASPSTTVRWVVPTENDAAPVVTASFKVCDESNGLCTAPSTTDTLTSTAISLPHEGTFTVHVWLGDAAGNSAEATAAATVIRYASESPGRPLGLASDIGSGWQQASRATLTWQAPLTSFGAPVIDAYVQRCDAAGGCTTPTLTGSPTSGTVALPTDGVYTVHVWLKNEAELASPATAAQTTLRRDSTPPATPSQLIVNSGSSMQEPTFRATWTAPPPDGGSPLGARIWTLCQAATCVSGTTSADDVTVTAPSPGSWTFGVRAVDEAGNLSAASTAPFIWAPAQQPPDRRPTPDPDEPGTKPPVSRRPARLRASSLTITRLRAASGVLALRLSGAAQLNARVSIVVRTRGSRPLPTVRRNVRIRRGRVTVRIGIPRGARQGRIVATTPRTSAFRAGRSVRAFNVEPRKR